MTELRAENITVCKNSHVVVDDATLSCASGQCLVILGENGAGKSVLLRTLALVEPGASGLVHALERDYHLSGEPLKVGPWPDLTIVLQSLALWPHLSAEENVLTPWRKRATAKRLSRGEVDEIFDTLEIEDLKRRFPAELSGGQRQRVAIARALALAPAVLLLDEPSSALDARQAAALIPPLQKLKSGGATVICVTHNLGFASRIADRYAFLHKGRIVDSGTWVDLSKSASVPLEEYLEINLLR